MATSGTTIYESTRDVIVRRALRIVGAYPTSGSPRPEHTRDTIVALNQMLKAWSVEGLSWLRTFSYMFPESSKVSYKIGPLASGGDHCVTSYTEGAVAADALTGSATFDLDAGHGLTTTTTGWIGIRSSGVFQWFQGYTVAVNTITLDGVQVLTSDISDGDLVIAHSAAAQVDRTLHVYGANRKTGSTNEVPMLSLTRADYMRLTNKASTGTPVQFYYDPQMTVGTMYVWPAPQTTTTDVFVVDIDAQLDVMTDSLNTFEVPMHWQETVVYCLADRIAPEFGVSQGERQWLKREAEAKLLRMVTEDRDVASIYFGVSR